jgi:N-acetylglucosaminyl-diphospho-decaprenol L-rhamnosyltransferase
LRSTSGLTPPAKRSPFSKLAFEIFVSLSIVIVSFNARADIERCLASLRSAPPATAREVVVVDNASSDGSVDVVRRQAEHLPLRVITLDRNLGFAAANNVGIRASSGGAVLLLNSDTIVPPGAVDGLMRTLDDRPEATVVGPRLVDGEGRAELSFGKMISPVSEWRQKRLVVGNARREPHASARVEALTRMEHWPDWVSGACLLVRRAEADAVGLLDERYFMYTEDVDFCAAIRARGGRILFTPAVEVVHLRGRSAASAPAATRAAYRRSHLAFYRKHHPALAPLLAAYQRMRDVFAAGTMNGCA